MAEASMDEVFVRRDLIEPRRLRALSGKSDVAGFIQLGSHLGAIALATLALYLTWGSIWCVPAFMVQGMLINYLYAGQHEMSHWTVFKTKKLNEIFGRLTGFVLFYLRDFDQIQHFAHHRHTQDWNQDGELLRAPYTLRAYLLWFFGPTYWYTRIMRILRFACGVVNETYVPDRRKADLIREARWHVAGYAAIAAVSIATGSAAALIYWLAPMIAMKFTHQLQNTIEHLGLEHSDNILENTRSTKTNALMRWLCWNMQYHTAHHAFPGVPFHKLPHLHAAMFTERGVEPQQMGYLAFQRAVIHALSAGRSEADYPNERAWIDSKPVAGAPVNG
jgi:fatty acid desaturase